MSPTATPSLAAFDEYLLLSFYTLRRAEYSSNEGLTVLSAEVPS